MSQRPRAPFTRCLLLCDAGEPDGAVAVARALAPHTARVHALVVVAHDALYAEAPDGEGAADVAAEALRAQTAGWAELVVEAVAELDEAAVELAAREHAADLIVVATRERPAWNLLRWTERMVAPWGAAVAWVGPQARPVSQGIARALIPFEGELGVIAPIAVFVRDRLGGGPALTLLAVGAVPPELGLEPTRMLAAVTGASAVELVYRRRGLFDLGDIVTEVATARAIDLVVVSLDATATGPGRLVASALAGRWLTRAPAVVLVMPGLASAGAAPGALDACDLLELPDGTLLGLHVDELDAQGRPTPCTGTVALEAGGQRTTLALDAGNAAPGRFAADDVMTVAVAGLGAAATRTRRIQLAARRVVLVDPALWPAIAPATLPDAAAGGGDLALAVRLDPRESFASLRARLATAGRDAPPIACASALLDDGAPGDLPPGTEAIQLARCAARLRAAGVAVTAIAVATDQPPAAHGFAVLTPGELGQAELPAASAALSDDPLTELTGAERIAGNRVAIELDNARARNRLVAWIDAAVRTIHVELYIIHDDPVAADIEAALARAARRGARVRLLVDSLYGRHGSFGGRNAMCDRLAAERGVEVRVYRPIDHVPSLEELKQRDHRKLVVIDGERGVVTGRNLAAAYYQGFAEVVVTADTPFGDIPWLDAGVELEGPAVARLEDAFCAAWARASTLGSPEGPAVDPTGGHPRPTPRDPASPIERVPAPAAIPGGSTVRVVLHDGLRDAHTLDAYLALIRAARSHIYLVNTFPIQEELQHGLRAALARGVHVRALCGHVRPLHGDAGTPFPGGGGALRELATQLVFSHLDPLIAAGAAVYELALHDVPGWDPALGAVLPHVHAKVMSCDGECAAIGSANLDVTAGFWENEALVVIEDPRVAATLEAALDALLAGSRPVDRDDPSWQRRAGRRAWLDRVWPKLLG